MPDPGAPWPPRPRIRALRPIRDRAHRAPRHPRPPRWSSPSPARAPGAAVGAADPGPAPRHPGAVLRVLRGGRPAHPRQLQLQGQVGRLAPRPPRRDRHQGARGHLLQGQRREEGWQPQGAERRSPRCRARCRTPGPTTTLVPHLKRPSSVPLVVKPGTAGEGEWQPTGPVVGGQPGMYIAQFRADDIYTSQLASAVWIDPKLLRVRLVPGYQEPGGDWVQPHSSPARPCRRSLRRSTAASASRTRMAASTSTAASAIPLVDGAASMVIYKDGRINIGLWGRDVAIDRRRPGRAPEPHAHGRQRRARRPHQPQRHQLLGLHPRRQHRGGPVGHRRHQGRRAGLRRRAHAHRQEPGREPAAGRRGAGHDARHQPRVGHVQPLRAPQLDQPERGQRRAAVPAAVAPREPLPQPRGPRLLHDLED